MACGISYRGRAVSLSNRQFDRLLDLALEVAGRAAAVEGFRFVDRMRALHDDLFWPGRGIDIEADFPGVDERKFWCQAFLDTARAIFDRTVGHHDCLFWQAQCIHQAYATGDLFHESVRIAEPRWEPVTLDGQEFDRVMNGR